MKNVKPLLVGLLAASGLAFSPLSQAQMSAQQLYVGVGFGQSKAKDACTSLLPGITCDDTDTATRLFGGYRFNRNVAFEVGYSDLGKASASIPGISEEWKATTWDFLAVGILPINEQFALLGKIGLTSWSVDDTATGFPKESASGTDTTYALGVQYDLSSQIGLRAEWQNYSNLGDENTTGQSDVDVIGVSALYRFQ